MAEQAPTEAVLMITRRTLDAPRGLNAVIREAKQSRPVRTAPEGRTCAAEGCATILSRYNLKTRCGVHEAPIFRRRTDPRTRIADTSNPNRLEKRDVCFREERIIRAESAGLMVRGGPTGRTCHRDKGHAGPCDYF